MKILEMPARVQIKNVLFATDFSDAATAAIPYAKEFAKRFGAKLFALHVMTPVVNPMTEPTAWPALIEASEREAKRQKEALLKEFKGIQPEVFIEEGGLWPILESTIEHNQIDLIVLGTHGRHGLKKMLLGSVAEEILRKAPCAVLTVGPNLPTVPKNTGKISEIVYATNLGPESNAAAACAVSLAQEFQARLTLVHVLAESKTGELFQDKELVASTTRLLKKLVPPEAELWCEPRFVVEKGEPGEKILEVAEHKRADLIVLGVHKPTGVPGAATHLSIATVHKVVAHATCPVLTVRETERRQ